MKTLLTILAPAFIVAQALAAERVPAVADSTGLPGDHFDLQGAVELFKVARDLEGFERSLNTEDQHVNNLDLDGDGKVDYIRVIDHSEGVAHAITMQVALGKDEFQDVAVIELEKNGDTSAVLQIRGAEELYGADVIVEPFEEKEVAPTDKGPSAPDDLPRIRIWVNVWAWPCVTWIYGPTYIVWNSPWYWGYYPPWWSPWTPWGWSAWYGWNRPYWGWYHQVGMCRTTNAHAVYQHRASHSVAVRQRTQALRAAREATRAQPTKQDRRPGEAAPRQRQRNNGVKPHRQPQPTTRPAPGRGGSNPGRTAPVRRSR